MKRTTLLSAIVGAGFALASTVGHALVIGFSPVAQSKFAGETASVNVVLSGLSAASQVVSGFDIDVSYSGDPTVAFLGGAYGTSLGVVDTETISFTPSASGGVVELFNASLLDDLALDALQGDIVILATLQFRSNTAIASALSISFNPTTDIKGVADPQNPGFATNLAPTVETGAIEWIRRNGTPMPLPGTLLLLLAGPLAWVGVRRN